MTFSNASKGCLGKYTFVDNYSAEICMIVERMRAYHICACLFLILRLSILLYIHNKIGE